MPGLTQLYINGNYGPSSSGETFEVHNPFSGQVVGTAASASSADGKAAVDAAAKAFKTWEYSSPNDRRDIFLRAATLLESDKYRAKVAQCMAEEVAAPLYWSLFNIMGSANLLRTQAGMVERLKGEIFPSGTVPGAQVISQRRAMGVVCVLRFSNLWFRSLSLTDFCFSSAFVSPLGTHRSHSLSGRSRLLL
jgi:acyl-CoA reductase-like NAD-dependent aldehyde dehydrogenase